MSVAVTDTRAPRPPGSRFHAHTALTPKTRKHAPGRVCATPGCGTILRSTNPDQTCDPCQRKARRARETQKEAVTLAAGKQQQKTKQISDAVRQYAETHQWNAYFTAKDCATVVGCGESTAKKRLTRLVESGLLESSPRLGYARRQRGGIVKDSPADSQSSDNAPEPLREQTPDASAPDSAGPALQASPASGGVYQGDKDYQQYTAASSDDIAEAMRRTSNFDSEAMTVDWFRPPAPRLTEAAVIGWFEDAGRVERRRVLDYLLERW